MPGFISSGSTIAAGIRDDFDLTYQPAYKGVLDSLGEVMRLDVAMNHRTETFGMHETMPYPERFDEGNESIPEEGTGSKSFSVTTFDYGKRVSWKVKDREDNKVGDLRAKANALGEHFASIPSRAFVELITGSASLLPSIPNAPDGAAPFSATDGASADRFGVSGGNLVTGGGVTTSALITTDFFAAVARFGRMLDVKGQPYWEPNVTQERYVVYYGIANIEKFTQAFAALAIHSTIAGTSTTNVTTGAGVSNIILASGVQVTLRPTSRITDNDWFVFRAGSPIKTFFMGTKRPLEMSEATKDNSDTTRDIAKEYVQFTTRLAFGVNVPFSAVKVNN